MEDLKKSFRQSMKEMTGLPSDVIPGSYQILGDIMLLKLLRCSESEKEKIASSILKLYPYVRTVCEIRGIEGELRQPVVRKIEGNGTETVHKESGILYKLDVSKVMFSKGNHFERQRIAKQVKGNETVVDMFAGIGYFSLPIAKKAAKVYAIEKNPVAFRYLKENIRLNKINNVEAMNADCRDVSLGRIADRVIMGYFPNTEKFLPSALGMLKERGIMHFHNTYMEDELWGKPQEELANFRILRKKKVKSVAPRCWHVVMDAEVGKSF